MKRLTTDNPQDNFETMVNFVYGKDGWAHIRYDGENENVPLTEWARKQCLSRACYEFPAKSAEDIDLEICDCMMDFPDCPVALAYCFASQAVHLRDRLKMYEDILFAEDGTELISLDRLREMVSQNDNPPLTLEELREMDGEPVWISYGGGVGFYDIFCGVSTEDIAQFLIPALPISTYGKTWLAYRRKPEEDVNHAI